VCGAVPLSDIEAVLPGFVALRTQKVSRKETKVVRQEFQVPRVDSRLGMTILFKVPQGKGETSFMTVRQKIARPTIWHLVAGSETVYSRWFVGLQELSASRKRTKSKKKLHAPDVKTQPDTELIQQLLALVSIYGEPEVPRFVPPPAASTGGQSDKGSSEKKDEKG
jgi:hypothetical protein